MKCNEKGVPDGSEIFFITPTGTYRDFFYYPHRYYAGDSCEAAERTENTEG